ncbi:hypothetical protein YPC_0768 [Yersinia pestis biovar Medievalis str. Harbin 35]|uniref:Uncharacterized protein n=1 Tax=Yersinia pestis TaxID=632 RepID=Q8CKJ1_YERPE|nr:hypothetical [Yersinia pestis KIM10+]ADV97465.1 hypothetical protein YPC_0768 [Yersinia pestis biovar Medievalis str. Harbin 35]EEO75719.1 hypothetical protein YP516_3652 [Yersinia pestis Nepal516]EEO82301.1 hypothetical protein YPF_1112 [Yersinia pestis biovar Orientalis str. India 195]EEO87091.1 hypothetical protein YPH_3024 [Yersinia pestis biovar Orientalis str. PEXU2]EEO91654.1 hypothetical protein YPS_0598 [Yersinia pestis Pestoides A]
MAVSSPHSFALFKMLNEWRDIIRRQARKVIAWQGEAVYLPKTVSLPKCRHILL